MSKVGKALGFSMDKEDNAQMSTKGYNDSDIDKTAGLSLGDEGGGDESPASSMGDPSDGMKPKDDMMSAGPEVLAMKMFEKASTPEAKVEALKAFGEACGWTGGGSGDMGPY